MARWILFRDMGERRIPCEVARCEAPDLGRAVEVLARFAGDRAQIAAWPPVRPKREPSFYVQSAASVAEDAASRRLLARPLPELVHERRRPEKSA